MEMFQPPYIISVQVLSEHQCVALVINFCFKIQKNYLYVFSSTFPGSDDLQAYRYSEEKLLSWLHSKVNNRQSVS